MILEVLGVGGGNTPELGSSSFLIWDDDMNEAVLMDCGYMTYPRLKELESRVYPRREIIKKIKSVAISHLHNDHAGSLGALLAHCYYLTKQTIFLTGVKTLQDYLNLIEGQALKCIAGEDSRLKVISISHGDMAACAFYFNGVLYSGDTDKPLLNLPEAKEAKIIIHEARLNSIPPHTNIEDLAASAPKSILQKTWIIHYAPDMAEKIVIKAKELGFAGVLFQGQVLKV